MVLVQHVRINICTQKCDEANQPLAKKCRGNADYIELIGFIPSGQQTIQVPGWIPRVAHKIEAQSKGLVSPPHENEYVRFGNMMQNEAFSRGNGTVDDTWTFTGCTEKLHATVTMKGTIIALRATHRIVDLLKQGWDPGKGSALKTLTKNCACTPVRRPTFSGAGNLLSSAANIQSFKNNWGLAAHSEDILFEEKTQTAEINWTCPNQVPTLKLTPDNSADKDNKTTCIACKNDPSIA